LHCIYSMNLIELPARSVSTDFGQAQEINKAIIHDSMSDYEKYVFSSRTLCIWQMEKRQMPQL